MLKNFLRLKFSPVIAKLQRHPNHLVMGTAGLTLMLFAPLAWMTGQSYYNFNHIQQREFRLRRLSDQITYYDEILTTSARLKVMTGEQRWDDRYQQYDPKIKKALADAAAVAALTEIDDSQVKTNQANDKLEILEIQAFKLLEQGKQAEAIALFDSQEYKKWKQLHRAGVQRRNMQIQKQLELKVDAYRYHLLSSIGITGISLLLLIPAWGLVLNLLRHYIQDLNQSRAALEATNQNLEGLVAQRSQELTQRNEQLETALHDLQETQAQLVQSAKMSSLGQLVAGIAHEINNPVNFIHGNLRHVGNYSRDLIQAMETYDPENASAQTKLDELKSEYDFDFVREDLPKLLKSMQTGTDRIREIVLSLRNFSRLDEAERKAVDIHEGIESSLMILQHNLTQNAHGLAIQIEKNYGELPDVLCYPGLINQVLMNLLSNAIDALEPNDSTRPPTIRITTKQVEQQLQIQVTDNGVGMSEEDQKSLFNPFFTTKPVGQGTGLGLSISYKIITEQHQGKIWVESTIGQGSTFWISIPLEENRELSA